MSDQFIYGWFDDASQTKPSVNPPLDAICPLCGAPVTPDDVRTHSLMPLGYAPRSYFYRTHRTCDEAPHALSADDVVLQMIERNGD